MNMARTRKSAKPCNARRAIKGRMRNQPKLARRIATFAALLIPTVLSAQKTWVVDAKNGAGTDFTDLPAAFAKVADGDRVVVRAGTYKPGQLDKAIRLIAEPGATVAMSSTDFLITGIGAGKTCVLEGLQFQGGFLIYGLVRVQDNAGLVVFANVRVELQGATNGVYVKKTKAVTLTDSTVRPQLTVEESEVSAARCTFGPYPTGAVTVGIYAYKARLDLAQCVAWGFNGGGHAPSTWAIRAAGTSMVIRGDANSSYIGGTYDNKPESPSIIGNNDSTLVVDPAVVLSPAPAQMQSITKKRLPALYARGGSLGGSLDLELYSPATHPYVLAVALPTTPFDLPFGRQWLDIPTEILLVFGVQGSAGFTKHSYSVPGSPTLRGLALGFQGLSGSEVLDLTNPVIPVLH